jgi:TolB-like protein
VIKEKEQKITKQTVSLAVLPFDNLTGIVEQDYFSRGFVEDLIIDLSRFPTLQIISSHTSFSSQSARIDEKQAARNFGAEYILKGTLRRLGNTLRINTQLVEPFSNRILWAERYDAPVETIFDIHDNIIEQVVSALSVKIETSRLSDARKKSDTQLEAYDCWLRGFEYLRQGTLKDDENARTFFKRALEINPYYGRAYAGLSLSYFNEWSCQLWERWDKNEQLAYENALQASKYDETDHIIQMVLGRVLLYRRKFDQAVIHLDRALELNPNDADNLVQLAGSKALLGQGEEGIRLFQKALELNPYHNDWYYLFGAMPYFVQRRYREMIEITKKINPTLSVDLSAYLAAAHAYLGDGKQAAYFIVIYHKTFLEKITYGRQPDPGAAMRWLKHVNPYKNTADAEHFEKGMLLAGLEKSTVTDPVGTDLEFTPETDCAINSFRKINKLWELGFENCTVQLPEVKGFVDLSLLLSRPGEKMHCAELMGSPVSYNDGEDVLDEKAQRSYKKRIRELQEELEESEAMNDIGRSQLIREEMDKIIDHLSKSLGLGGRSRKIGATSERARTAVTWRIRNAIRKINEVHPRLAKHLSNTVQTGTFFMYSPEKESHWQL